MPVNLSDDRTFGTYHLADNPSFYEPARSNNFRLVIYGIDNMQLPNTDGNEASDFIRNGQEIIDFSADSVPIPHFQINPITNERGNSAIKFAGKPSWSSGSFVINDWIGARGKDVLMAWQNLVYDVKRDVVHRVAVTGYKKKCHLIEYTTDNVMIRYWELQGCWPSNISEDSMANSGGNDQRKLTVTIEYDRAIPHQPDDEFEEL